MLKLTEMTREIKNYQYSNIYTHKPIIVYTDKKDK